MKRYSYQGGEFTALLVQGVGQCKQLTLFGKGSVWTFRVPKHLCHEATRAYRRKNADALLKVCERIITVAANTGQDLVQEDVR